MEFVGMGDDFGKQIREGDILDCDNLKQYVVKYGRYTHTSDLWNYSDHLGWYADEIGSEDKDKLSLPYVVDILDGVVVGNVNDKPELLKEETE